MQEELLEPCMHIKNGNWRKKDGPMARPHPWIDVVPSTKPSFPSVQGPGLSASGAVSRGVEGCPTFRICDESKVEFFPPVWTFLFKLRHQTTAVSWHLQLSYDFGVFWPCTCRPLLELFLMVPPTHKALLHLAFPCVQCARLDTEKCLFLCYGCIVGTDTTPIPRQNIFIPNHRDK